MHAEENFGGHSARVRQLSSIPMVTLCKKNIERVEQGAAHNEKLAYVECTYIRKPNVIRYS
jgi:hypothetical protein